MPHKRPQFLRRSKGIPTGAIRVRLYNFTDQKYLEEHQETWTFAVPDIHGRFVLLRQIDCGEKPWMSIKWRWQEGGETSNEKIRKSIAWWQGSRPKNIVRFNQ